MSAAISPERAVEVLQGANMPSRVSINEATLLCIQRGCWAGRSDDDLSRRTGLDIGQVQVLTAALGCRGAS